MMRRRGLGLGLLVLGGLSQLGFSGLQQEVESDQLGFWLVLLLIVIVLVVLLWWSLRGTGRSSRSYLTTEEKAAQSAAQAEHATAAAAAVKEKAEAEVDTAEVAAETAEVVEAVAEVPAADDAAEEAVSEAEAVEEPAAVEAEETDAEDIEQAQDSAAAGEPDNLRVIEGIGPKVNGALNAMGITTFAQLAEADPEKLEADLRAANVRILPGAPQTWPDQAALAAKGDWAGFEKLTESLKGGRRVE